MRPERRRANPHQFAVERLSARTGRRTKDWPRRASLSSSPLAASIAAVFSVAFALFFLELIGWGRWLRPLILLLLFCLTFYEILEGLLALFLILLLYFPLLSLHLSEGRFEAFWELLLFTTTQGAVLLTARALRHRLTSVENVRRFTEQMALAAGGPMVSYRQSIASLERCASEVLGAPATFHSFDTPAKTPLPVPMESLRAYLRRHGGFRLGGEPDETYLLVEDQQAHGFLRVSRRAFPLPSLLLLAEAAGRILTTVRFKQDLSDHLRLLETVLDAAPDGLLLVSEGQILYGNPRGLEVAEVFGEAFTEHCLRLQRTAASPPTLVAKHPESGEALWFARFPSPLPDAKSGNFVLLIRGVQAHLTRAETEEEMSFLRQVHEDLSQTLTQAAEEILSSDGRRRDDAIVASLTRACTALDFIRAKEGKRVAPTPRPFPLSRFQAHLQALFRRAGWPAVRAPDASPGTAQLPDDPVLFADRQRWLNICHLLTVAGPAPSRVGVSSGSSVYRLRLDFSSRKAVEDLQWRFADHPVTAQHHLIGLYRAILSLSIEVQEQTLTIAFPARSWS